nr:MULTISPECIES: DUF6162 family protein [unclassified Pseudodesulfovibrio]
MGIRKRTTRCEVVVCPSGTGQETWMVFAAALVTVIMCSVAIVLRNTTASARVVPAWQVDAFKELRAEELAIFNGLYTAAPEIQMYHEDDGGWPTVDALASWHVPPFVHDAAWIKNGAFGWTRSVIATQDEHVALYVGHPQDSGESCSFLLVMLHEHDHEDEAAHAPYEIWLHASPVEKIPTMISDQALINKGWREVVARKGEDEMKHTKNEERL